MTAMNIVHMRVKPGKDDEFLAIHRAFGVEPIAGIESFDIVKTGVPGVAWLKLDTNAEWPAPLAIKLPREQLAQ